MAYYKPNIDSAEMVRKTKIETTYEYVPIIGGILGFWRKQKMNRVGDDLELHINCGIGEMDRLFINGEEVKEDIITKHIRG